MVFSSDLMTQLDVLTEALDGSGDDLPTILGVLVDDLAGGISSFAGLSVTVSVGGEPVTMTAMNSSRAVASVLLPLTAGTRAGHIVFYAQNPGAFNDLAADAQFTLGTGGDIIVDGHLPPPTSAAAHRDLNGLTDRSTINQAIGFLIGQGYPPTQAQAELARRATAAGVSLPQTACQILQTAHRPDPDALEQGQDLHEPTG